jgi:hypothetical protein
MYEERFSSEQDGKGGEDSESAHQNREPNDQDEDDDDEGHVASSVLPASNAEDATSGEDARNNDANDDDRHEEGKPAGGEIVISISARSRDLMDTMVDAAVGKGGYISRKDRATARAKVLDALLRDAEMEAEKLPPPKAPGESEKGRQYEGSHLVRVRLGSKNIGSNLDGHVLLQRISKLHTKVPLGTNSNPGMAINTLVVGTLLRAEHPPPHVLFSHLMANGKCPIPPPHMMMGHPMMRPPFLPPFGPMPPSLPGQSDMRYPGGLIQGSGRGSQHQAQQQRQQNAGANNGSHNNMDSGNQGGGGGGGAAMGGADKHKKGQKLFAHVLHPLSEFSTDQLMSELTRRGLQLLPDGPIAPQPQRKETRTKKSQSSKKRGHPEHADMHQPEGLPGMFGGGGGGGMGDADQLRNKRRKDGNTNHDLGGGDGMDGGGMGGGGGAGVNNPFMLGPGSFAASIGSVPHQPQYTPYSNLSTSSFQNPGSSSGSGSAPNLNYHQNLGNAGHHQNLGNPVHHQNLGNPGHHQNLGSVHHQNLGNPAHHQNLGNTAQQYMPQEPFPSMPSIQQANNFGHLGMHMGGQQNANASGVNVPVQVLHHNPNL